MRENINPEFREAVRVDPTIGTPLFDEKHPLEPRPQRTIELSATQLEAWQKVKGKLCDVRLLILTVISHIGPCCARHVARELEWEINRVSGRMTELKRMSLIEPDLDDNGKIRRDTYTFGGEQYSGERWKVRPDWKEFLEAVKNYPGVLI